MTVREAAAVMGVTVGHLRRLIYRGRVEGAYQSERATRRVHGFEYREWLIPADAHGMPRVHIGRRGPKSKWAKVCGVPRQTEIQA